MHCCPTIKSSPNRRDNKQLSRFYVDVLSCAIACRTGLPRSAEATGRRLLGGPPRRKLLGLPIRSQSRSVRLLSAADVWPAAGGRWPSDGTPRRPPTAQPRRPARLHTPYRPRTESKQSRPLPRVPPCASLLYGLPAPAAHWSLAGAHSSLFHWGSPPLFDDSPHNPLALLSPHRRRTPTHTHFVGHLLRPARPSFDVWPRPYAPRQPALARPTAASARSRRVGTRPW